MTLPLAAHPHACSVGAACDRLLIPHLPHACSVGAACDPPPAPPAMPAQELPVTLPPPPPLRPAQEELEAYDKYQRQLEDALDGKTAELIALRR